jgi:hypothetical protein
VAASSNWQEHCVVRIGVALGKASDLLVRTVDILLRIFLSGVQD